MPGRFICTLKVGESEVTFSAPDDLLSRPFPDNAQDAVVRKVGSMFTHAYRAEHDRLQGGGNAQGKSEQQHHAKDASGNVVPFPNRTNPDG